MSLATYIVNTPEGSLGQITLCKEHVKHPYKKAFRWTLRPSKGIPTRCYVCDGLQKLKEIEKGDK